MGLLKFFTSLLAGMIFSGIGYVALSFFFELIGSGIDDGVTECVQGLSGALFALKVLALAEVDTIW